MITVKVKGKIIYQTKTNFKQAMKVWSDLRKLK